MTLCPCLPRTPPIRGDYRCWLRGRMCCHFRGMLPFALFSPPPLALTDTRRRPRFPVMLQDCSRSSRLARKLPRHGCPALAVFRSSRNRASPCRTTAPGSVRRCVPRARLPCRGAHGRSARLLPARPAERGRPDSPPVLPTASRPRTASSCDRWPRTARAVASILAGYARPVPRARRRASAGPIASGSPHPGAAGIARHHRRIRRIGPQRLHVIAFDAGEIPQGR